MDISVGDRLQYQRGNIWKIKEIPPNSIVVSSGMDLVTVRKEELSGYFGEVPWAEMNWRLVK